MRALIIGLGIGNVYIENLKQRNIECVSIDIDQTKNPTYTSFDQLTGNKFDLGIICTPTYLHEEHLLKIKDICNIILIEKPGLTNSDIWIKYAKEIPIRMVKNNIYRTELKYLHTIISETANEIKQVNINWLSKDRTPYPGSWFTDKSKEGGITKDLFPHLLHYYYILSGKQLSKPICYDAYTTWKFDQVCSTQYGKIQTESPIYNADDYASALFMTQINSIDIPFKLTAAWKTDVEDKLNIEIINHSGSKFIYEIRLCPNFVYGKMIDDIVEISDNIIVSYEEHLDIDLWIHDIINLIRNIHES